MKRWKQLSCLAAAAVIGVCSPMSSWASLSDYDGETAARLQDNNLEYDELKNLIREYNPQIKYAYNQLEETMNETEADAWRIRRDLDSENYEVGDETLNTRDYINELKKQKRQLEEMPENSQTEVAIQTLETAISGLESLMTAPGTLKKTTREQLESAKKTLDTTVRQIQQGAETLMVTYDNLAAQIETLEKVEELQKESVETAKVQDPIGLGTSTTLLTAQSSLLSTQSQLESLKNTAAGLKTQLGLLTGWSADSDPVVGHVPEASPELIDQIDLQADIQKAIGNNQTLISQRHASGEKSTVGTNNRLMNLAQSEQQLTVEMERLYQDILQKKASYDAAMTAWDRARIEWDSAQAMYQMGMMSKLQYLGAQVSYYQAQGAKKSADSALFQSMLTYDWAVQGFVEVPQ